MRVFQINSVCGIRSTGRIATDIYNTLKSNGHECVIAYGREEAQNIDKNDIVKIGNKYDVLCHALLSRLTDRTGFYSKKATYGLVKKIKEYNPDIIQLHNIHGYYINLEVLFEYFSKIDTPVVWTLHDCWPFTGHCAYYDNAGCNKWKTGCFKCPQKKEYPTSILLDNSKKNYLKKSEFFNSVKNLHFIAISEWIAAQARQSFLKDKSITVIHNGIDLTQFKPTESNFRQKYSIEGKKIILGVANIWDKRKGFDTFIELAKRISSKEIIVMVGLSDKQLSELPQNIIGVKRTNSIKELAEIYTEADVFVNPTMEDNLPTVNIEALACGTPVITYDTGGSPECISPESGIVVPKGDIEGLINGITKANFSQENLLKHSRNFDKTKKYKEYIDVYKRCLND
ncbi:MAG: glycosyltransferase [Clostridia bacterium]|nr:glycosyltransferase [Clostridia bacterium]